MTFLVPIVKFFFLTKNGNQKGHEYHKGLKIANFSYLMRSKVTLPGFAEVNFNSLKSIGHVGWSRNCRFAGLGRPWVILGKSSFYLMKSAENSWVCSGSMNTTVHWAYRGQVLSLISNLQYHTDPGKKKFWKSEHVHFLNIFWQNQTMCAAPHAPGFQTMHMPRDGANTVDSYIYRHWWKLVFLSANRQTHTVLCSAVCTIAAAFTIFCVLAKLTH